jgi:hypothetical protein
LASISGKIPLRSIGAARLMRNTFGGISPRSVTANRSSVKSLLQYEQAYILTTYLGVLCMTIQYSVTPNEVTKSYIQQLRYSSAFRIRILTFAVLIFLIYFLTKLLRQGFRLSDLIVALLLGCGVIILLPLTSRLLTKPQQRTLTISQEGIQTSIGAQTGTIPWAKVADVVDDGDYIFVIGRTGNSFLIPSRAFASSGQRNAFLEMLAKYRSI